MLACTHRLICNWRTNSFFANSWHLLTKKTVIYFLLHYLKYNCQTLLVDSDTFNTIAVTTATVVTVAQATTCVEEEVGYDAHWQTELDCKTHLCIAIWMMIAIENFQQYLTLFFADCWPLLVWVICCGSNIGIGQSRSRMDRTTVVCWFCDEWFWLLRTNVINLYTYKD